jgi:hypothetical protein
MMVEYGILARSTQYVLTIKALSLSLSLCFLKTTDPPHLKVTMFTDGGLFMAVEHPDGRRVQM